MLIPAPTSTSNRNTPSPSLTRNSSSSTLVDNHLTPAEQVPSPSQHRAQRTPRPSVPSPYPLTQRTPLPPPPQSNHSVRPFRPMTRQIPPFIHDIQALEEQVSHLQSEVAALQASNAKLRAEERDAKTRETIAWIKGRVERLKCERELGVQVKGEKMSARADAGTQTQTDSELERCTTPSTALLARSPTKGSKDVRSISGTTATTHSTTPGFPRIRKVLRVCFVAGGLVWIVMNLFALLVLAWDVDASTIVDILQERVPPPMAAVVMTLMFAMMWGVGFGICLWLWLHERGLRYRERRREGERQRARGMERLWLPN